MSYLLSAKLLTSNDEVSTLRNVQVNNYSVYAYDADKGVVVPNARVSLMKPKMVTEKYITIFQRERGKSLLETTLDHIILVEVDGKMDVMTIDAMITLVNAGHTVRLFKPDSSLSSISASGMVVSKDDIGVHYPASFVMDLELERVTLLPLVSFDGGASFVIA